MVRCGCASDQCSCSIVAGENVTISGTGSKGNPYVVSAATQVVDESGTPAPSGGGRLTGEIIAYGGSSAPSGWLLCNGLAVNRAVYADLFAVLGTSYGAGDGSTTFNLPDLTGRFPMGASGSQLRGTQGGESQVALGAANLPAHAHSIDHQHSPTAAAGTHDHGLRRSAAVGGANGNIPQGTTNTVEVDAGGAVEAAGSHTHTIPAYTGTSGSSGDGVPLDVTPPYTTVNYIVKV